MDDPAKWMKSALAVDPASGECKHGFMRLRLLAPALLLTSCVDPYGNPMNPFGPQTPPPYTDQREQWRNQTRDQGQQQNQYAYERGISDGRADANANLSKSYARHYQSYTPATQAAYQQGYDQGYLPPLAPLPGAGGFHQQPQWQQQPLPNTQAPTYPGSGGYTPPPTNDPAYQQGYDFGLRDRVAGRANDPAAHTGRYDPRNRRSFGRGYVDAYNAR